MISVAELCIYPIKSCQGISVSQATVNLQGFNGDRYWMIVDELGKFLTQRQYPQLAQITVHLEVDYLTISHKDLPDLSIPLTAIGELKEVVVWRDRTIAIDQGEEAAQWFSQVLRLNCRLVRQSEQQVRPVNPKYALWENQPVSFADGFPILLTNMASLDELNQKLVQPIKMDRFRANIVVHSDEPFAEDHWQVLEINGVKFVAAKPCDRCVVTTTDQITGERDQNQEPLRTLKTFRYVPNQGILFGLNMMPTTTGIIEIGMPVIATIKS